VGIIVIKLLPKGDLVLIINGIHTPILDFFFKNITFLGDGKFYAVFVFALLFVDYFYLILSLVCILFTTIIVQYMKLVLFHNEYRPLEFFKYKPELSYHLVSDIEISYFNSFPSGHTTTGFVMCTLIIILLAQKLQKLNPMIQVAIFLIAFLIGISRIYLLQHFFVDTYAGTFIGVAIVISCWYLLQNIRPIAKLESKSFIKK
jgi:membrane-associated phospholipid phosphatase